KSRLEEMVQRAEAERADGHVSRALFGKETSRPRSEIAITTGSDREQESDRLLSQSARGKPQRECRRTVKPLQVVDRDQHGRIGNRAESAEHRECDRRLIRSVLLRLTQQQRDLERPALRRRKLSDHELENRIEQIAETRIRDLTLRLGRPCRQDAVPDFLCLSGSGAPQRRLPDARLTLDEHGRGEALDFGEKRPHGREFLVTSDNLPLTRSRCSHYSPQMMHRRLGSDQRSRREDGAFMEPRGCNRWQSAANRRAAETAKTRQIRCHWLPPVALPKTFHGKEGVFRVRRPAVSASTERQPHPRRRFQRRGRQATGL